jgi:hypothetical protein
MASSRRGGQDRPAGRRGAKTARREEAVGGRFGDPHGVLLPTMGSGLDPASADLAMVEAELEAELGAAVGPFAQAVDRLEELGGSAGRPPRC